MGSEDILYKTKYDTYIYRMNIEFELICLMLLAISDDKSTFTVIIVTEDGRIMYQTDNV